MPSTSHLTSCSLKGAWDESVNNGKKGKNPETLKLRSYRLRETLLASETFWHGMPPFGEVDNCV